MRTIKLNSSVFSAIARDGDRLRKELKEKGIYLVNVMSSPGAGKTTALIALIKALSLAYRPGVIEADLDSDVDAKKVSTLTHCPAVQIHTDSLCHVDSDMVKEGIDAFKEEVDLLFLENVGNLLCPAEFDTGAHLNVALLSVADGTDKVMNYPKMLRYCGLVLINKMDALSYFDFDYPKVAGFIASVNPRAAILPISAKSGQGIEEAAAYFAKAITNWRKENA
jgi:hydrogenase nickel incorporation protein HypB